MSQSFESMDFSFANISSTTLSIRVYLITTDNGNVETPIMGQRSVSYDKVAFRDTVAVNKMEMDVIKFKIMISPLDKQWTTELRYQIFKWLGSRTPQPFKTMDNENKVIYGTFTNINNLILVNDSMGYCELDFEATTPYWLTNVYNFSADCTSASPSSPFSFTVTNLSNVQHPVYDWGCYYLPKMYVDLNSGATNFKLINTSDGNRETSFTDLTANEHLYIDNNLEEIEATSDSYVLNKFNGNFLKLAEGNNTITCYYPCTIIFECQFPQYV